MKRIFTFLFVTFEITYFCIRVSSNELNVPYVPYVVVDRNKDEFDYDRLQDVIVKYLRTKPYRDTYTEAPFDVSTTLYDFLKTSTPENEPHVDTRSINVQSPNLPNLQPSFQVNYFKPSTKDNSAITAIVKVTTFQPHRYTTPGPATFAQNYFNTSTIVKPSNTLLSKLSSSLPLPHAQGLREPAFEQLQYATNLGSKFKFPFANEMRCSLRSNRFVYDGECVSRKPVVETVCADRCIRYKYRKGKKPYFLEYPTNERSMKNMEFKKEVVALTCSDGDVQKQKIKLYCKDGTIINNIIRIVSSCICQEHSEKVHATKRNQRLNNELKKRTILRRTPLRMQLHKPF